MNRLKRAGNYVAGLALLSCASVATAAVGCGELVNAYGPFDYRKISNEQRGLVEGAHFTPEVETLTKGNHGSIASDIDYTLRAYPNNPRALLSMARLSKLKKVEQVEDAHYPTECYFDRAFRIAPDDPLPHLVYSIYLKDRNRKPEAMQQLEIAASLHKEQDTYVFPYNMALEYLDLGVYDKALSYAKEAYGMGAPFPGLRNKLVAAGKWVETKEEPAEATAPAPSAPSAPSTPTPPSPPAAP